MSKNPSFATLAEALNAGLTKKGTLRAKVSKASLEAMREFSRTEDFNKLTLSQEHSLLRTIEAIENKA